MEETNTAPEGGDNTPDATSAAPAAAVAPQGDIRVELHNQLREFESRVLDQVTKAVQPAKPQMTAEQYNELFKTNPQEAIKLAVRQTVQDTLQPELSRFTSSQRRDHFDQKAESDFPLLKSDPAYQRLVQDQMKEFLRDGEYTQDSPKLLYRAAEIAALKYKPKSGGQPKGGLSGEAPTTVDRSSRTSSDKPKNFEAMSRVFGLSKESQERFLAKLQTKGNK